MCRMACAHAAGNAAHFLSENYAGARVLTSWPATDELRNTYYGYTERALAVFPVESLKREDLEPARGVTWHPSPGAGASLHVFGPLDATDLA